MTMAAFRPATTTGAATTSTSTYAYDQNGNLTSKADPNLSAATYTFYDDFLGYGWSSAGWGSTVDFALLGRMPLPCHPRVLHPA